MDGDFFLNVLGIFRNQGFGGSDSVDHDVSSQLFTESNADARSVMSSIGARRWAVGVRDGLVSW